MCGLFVEVAVHASHNPPWHVLPSSAFSLSLFVFLTGTSHASEAIETDATLTIVGAG